MMKITALLTIIISFSANAQIVDIPDPNFKAALLNHVPAIDFNNNDEIEISEALGTNQINVNAQNINSLQGIEAFTNLYRLDCFGNHLTTLDLTALTNLQILECRLNNLTSLDVTGLANLTTIWCSENNLTSLSLDGLDNLKFIDCSGNSFGSINFNVAPSIESLYCAHNIGMVGIDISGLVNVKDLNLSYNWITALLLPPTAPNLEYVGLEYNSLQGTLDLSPYTALKRVRCNNTQLTQLILTGLTNLEELYCNNSLLTSLNLSGLNNLWRVECYEAALTTLNLAGTTALQTLWCSNNILTTIEINDSPDFWGLGCSHNSLTSIHIANPANMVSLICDNNQLTSLDLAAMPSLLQLHCFDNYFTSIDVSNASELHTLHFYNNPDLEYVNMKTGHIIPHLSLPEFTPVSCPSLSYICVDEENLAEMQNILQTQLFQNTTANSYCSFAPGGNHNTISGTLTYDANANGCYTDDIAMPHTRIDINADSVVGAVFTDANGNFLFYCDEGNYTITPHFENDVFVSTPGSATVNFDTDQGNIQTIDFCTMATAAANDLEVTLIPTTVARPGFDASYTIIYKNKGTAALSGSVDFVFQDDRLDIVSAEPANTGASNNHLIWEFSSLQPFETRTVNVTLNLNSPLETPAIENGNELNFAAIINPVANDITSADNIVALKQVVVGSFDPNDKTCLEGDSITWELVGQYLHYVIRFQNSGTFYAENVVVRDFIDTTKFDLPTLQLTASSHAHTTRITGNKVEFIFEGINLPAELDDEPGSHGYVAFKIKTLNSLAPNDVVENTADIFFDFNLPIVTNTASTTVSLLGLGEIENISVSISPNPVSNILNISAPDNITSIQLFDLQGRLLQTVLENDTLATIDFSAKMAGIYFIKVTTENGTSVQKIIKK